MKTTRKIMIAISMLVSATCAGYGTTNYWDNNSDTAGFGTAGGTWGLDGNWSGDSTGASVPGVTDTTAADQVNFGTATHGLASGTIMVNSNNQSFGTMIFGQASGAITLAGGEIQLVAPASSVVINNSTNTISSILSGTNGLNKAGTLSHIAFLTKNSVVIFQNTLLSDFKGIDGVMGGTAINGGKPLAADVFHFVHNMTNATCQLQVLDGLYTKCVGVELIQVGPDITGKVRYAKYVNGSQLGFNFDAGGIVQNVSTGYDKDNYGAAEIMLLPATRIYEGFLTNTAVAAFPNTLLANITGAAGNMAGKSIADTSVPGATYYFNNNGTTATFQLQIYNGGYTKCVKAELTQAGPDIEARAVYAKYYATQGSNVLGIDFDTASGISGNTLATSYTADGYGLAQLQLLSACDSSVLKLTGANTYSGPTTAGRGILEIAEGGQLGSGAYAADISSSGVLLFNITSNQVLSGAIAGIGSLVKTAPSNVPAPVVETYTSYLPEAPASAIILSNTQLSDCVAVGGTLGGLSITDGSGAVPYFFVNTGTNATWQLQSIRDTPWTKCIKIQLTQDGPNIAASVLYAKHIDNGSVLGYDFDKGGNISRVTTDSNTRDYGAKQTTITVNRYSKLTISGNNTYTGGTVVDKGTLEVRGTTASLPTRGGIIVNKGAELWLNVPGDPGTSGSVGGNNPITVNGGLLTVNGMFNVGHTRPVTINGGVMNSTITANNDNSNYINNLTLMNGAQVTGYKMRVGYVSSATITVSGTNTCSIPAGINMVKGAAYTLTLNVADVTGDDVADLTIPGVIRDYAGEAYENMPMTKVGAGTVSFSGVNTHKGLITINQGALALDGNNSLNINNPIVLNGGALNIGDFANSAGTLIVSNTNSLLVVGAGSIAFADSSATTWVNKLTVTGPLQANSVRFGTNANALTADQITAIKINGERATLRADGYLALAPSGSLIMVR